MTSPRSGLPEESAASSRLREEEGAPRPKPIRCPDDWRLNAMVLENFITNCTADNWFATSTERGLIAEIAALRSSLSERDRECEALRAAIGKALDELTEGSPDDATKILEDAI